MPNLTPNQAQYVLPDAVFKPANPAAGADLSFAVASPLPFVALTGQLVTSASVGNRFPSLVITDSTGSIKIEVAATNAQAASVTQSWCWMAGCSAAIVANPTTLPAPVGLTLAVGDIVKTSTAGILAGDQWSLFVITL